MRIISKIGVILIQPCNTPLAIDKYAYIGLYFGCNKLTAIEPPEKRKQMTLKLSRDTNGNKTLKVTAYGKSFSVQTLGNLPQVHRMTQDELNTQEGAIRAFADLVSFRDFLTSRQCDILESMAG